MFIDIGMVTIPILGFILFIVWAFSTELVNKLEDHCYFDRAGWVKIGSIVVYALIVGFGIWFGSNGQYQWVGMPVIIFAGSITFVSLCVLIFSGWDNVIYPLIASRISLWNGPQCTLWFASLALVFLLALATFAAVFHFDGFFNFVVNPDTLLDYHLAYSEFQDEHADWDWEELELYGD